MRLSVCAVFKNEAPYLQEWIDFHKLMGVDHFYLYNNNSDDDWQSATQYDYVTVKNWPMEVPSQQAAFKDALKTIDSKWIAFIDIDEFLFSPQDKLLPEVLEVYHHVPGLVVNWMNFGNNGHVTKPKASVLDSYIRRADLTLPANNHVKCIVQPEHTRAPNGTAHEFLYKSGFGVNTNFKRVLGVFNNPPLYDVLRINHYLTKSLEESKQRSLKGRIDIKGEKRDTFDTMQEELNLFEDRTIINVRDKRLGETNG